MHGAPEGYTGTNMAGNGEAVGTECEGQANVEDDATCCTQTSSGLASSQKLGVRCCSTRNPFIPKCSASAAHGNDGKFNVAAGAMGWSTEDMLTFKTSGNGGLFSVRKLFENLPKEEDPAQTGIFSMRCQPECAVLVDLKADYDIRSIAWWGGDFVNQDDGTKVYDPNNKPFANHKFLGWQPSGAGSGAEDVDDPLAMLTTQSADGWVELASKTGDSTGEVFSFNPVRVRYIKLLVTENDVPYHKWLRMFELQVYGCDSYTGGSVPELTGDSVEDFGYTCVCMDVCVCVCVCARARECVPLSFSC
jgi:hypothetical protein